VKNKKRYWNTLDSDMEEMMDEKKNDFFIKEPQFLETINNKIYFYSEIERDRILELNKEICLQNDQIVHEAITNKKDYKQDKIFLHINSYGGSVFSGFAAVDEILKSDVPVHTVIDGCAASAATLLSVVGKKRFMNKHSQILIHQLSSGMWGTYANFQDEMENLNLMMEMIKEIYLEHTKIPKDELEKILKHDLWLSPKKCLEWGIVDEIL